MHRFLLGALILILGQLSSRTFCQNFNLDSYLASSDYEGNDDEAQEAEINAGEKYSYGYSEGDVPGDFDFDPYQPRDDVAYWESIYGTGDVPDFEEPPPIDGDTIFMGLDDLTDDWDDQDVDEGIPRKRDAGETGLHLDPTSSSVKQPRNFENSWSSGNLDYRSMMADVYRRHFHDPNSRRGSQTYSTFESDEDEQLYGPQASARTAFSSNLEPQTPWASSDARRPQTQNSDIEDSQDIDAEMASELELTGQFPVAVESRSIKSSVRADSLRNSKRKISQAKKELINVAAAGESETEVDHAVYIEPKNDFISPSISTKVDAIQTDAELLHSIIGLDHDYGHSTDGQILGHLQPRSMHHSVLDSKQKVIQAKKDLTHASVKAGSEARLSDAFVKKVHAKKDLVDSILTTGSGVIDRTSQAVRDSIDKKLALTISDYDQSHRYSGNSRISGSMRSQSTRHSILDSKHKLIQAKKDLIHASAAGSRAEFTDAFVKTLDAKKDLVDSVISSRAGIVHGKKEFGHSTCCSANTAENFFSGAHRTEDASLNVKSQASGQIYADLQSGSIHDHQNFHKTEISSGLKTIQGEKSSLHSSLGGASNIEMGRKIELASSSSKIHKGASSLTLNEEIKNGGQISSNLHSGKSGVHSLESLHQINLAGNIAVEEGEVEEKVGVASSSGNIYKEGSSLISDKEIKYGGQISGNLQSGQSVVHSSESLNQINLGGNIAVEEEVKGEVGVAGSLGNIHEEGSSLISNKEIKYDGRMSSNLQSGKSVVHSSESLNQINLGGNIAVEEGEVEGEVGVASSSGNIHDEESSLISNKEIKYGGRISGNLQPGQSRVDSSESLSQINLAGNIAVEDEDEEEEGEIEGEVGVASSLSNGNHEGKMSYTFRKKIEDGSQSSSGQQLESISSQSEDDSLEILDQFNSAKAENSKTKFSAATVSKTTYITADKGPEVSISVSDSSSDETSEEISDLKSVEIESSGELSGFVNIKHGQVAEVHKNTEIKSSIGSKITLSKNLDLGAATHSSSKSEVHISSGISTQSNTNAAKIHEEESRATLKTAEIFGLDHKTDVQSIHKVCEPGQCGITGKLHVDFNVKTEDDLQRENEPETVVEYEIPQNLGSPEDDEESMEVSIQSPVNEAVVVDTGIAEEKSEEIREYEKHQDDKVFEDVIERTPDVGGHLIDYEGNQGTKEKNVVFTGDVNYESSSNQSEDAFSSDEEGESSQEQEFEDVGNKSEYELEPNEESIAVEKSSNSIIKSGTSEAQEAGLLNEEQTSLAIDHDGRFQASVKFGHLENNSKYHEHESSTHGTKFGGRWSDVASQHRKSQNKGQICHFELPPEDVEGYEAAQAFANAHCRLINLDVNCSGMTAFMKPECQQLNANLWHPQDSGTPITLWTVKTYLSHGQELAIEMHNRAKWLCDQGFVPKLHTPSMLHLINNLATEATVEINHESEFSLFGTKLLQRRLSSHFDVTPNNFVEFLHQHSFRVIGTGLCHARPKRCPADQIYRTFDGSCNNRNHPTWGQSNTAFVRLLPARYSDGVHAPPRSVTGSELPNPRALSVHCFSRKVISDRKLTLAASQWGQILSHDFALQTIDRTVEGGIRCCDDGKRQLPKNLQHHSCLPIDVSADDRFYSKFQFRCMNFVRSMTISREDCTLGPADQLNTVTSYLDASPLYGSNKETCDQLRTFKGGRMLVSIRRGRELLPTMHNKTHFCDAMSPSEVCYLAGDVRVNQNPQLAILQTSLLREHNRLADELTVLNPHWDDERLFQEARKILIAEYQYITYQEWLPLIIGKKYCQEHRLTTRCRGKMSRDYDPRIKASTINGFTAAAFRLFHSMVDGNINLCPVSGEISHTLRLSNHYFRPQIIERSNNLDDLIRGLVSQPMQKADKNFHPEITEYLFRSRNEFGMDLEAIDIQRGRDHGLPSYNAYRKICGLARAKDFDDLNQEIPQENIDKLKKIYAHVDDIDLIVGAVMENACPGSVLGPVARCLIGEQFYRSRIGDRYFYNHDDQPHSFTREQFEEIKKASFARLLCDTADNLREIQPRAFKIISSRNPLTCCDAIPKIDLYPWRESEY